jgi:hypothetical protein
MIIMATAIAMQIILLPEKLKTDCFETLVILLAFIPLISAFVKQKLNKIPLIRQQYYFFVLAFSSICTISV